VEGLKTGSGVLHRALGVPHAGAHLGGLLEPLVGVRGLVDGENAINVGVVQPEDGVIRGLRHNRHVTAGQDVNVVVNSFQAAGVEVAAIGGKGLRGESVVDLARRKYSPEVGAQLFTVVHRERRLALGRIGVHEIVGLGVLESIALEGIGNVHLTGW
jgi:hypothetical protein